MRFLSLCVCLIGLIGCAPILSDTITNPETHDFVPELTFIEEGRGLIGSTLPERNYAYQLDQVAYQSPITREQHWYDYEIQQQSKAFAPFFITKTPITNAQYAAFIQETNHPAPSVDAATWASYNIHPPFSSTQKFQWRGQTPPVGREDHPVVLVSHSDAQAYARWLSQKTGANWRLPREDEWEYAARGPNDNRRYPWGNTYYPDMLNSADRGPQDTMAVGRFPLGASAFGVLDMAGQVYEWTDTPGEKGRYTLKGGAWDDFGCGICRISARHHRVSTMKHTIIGFRLVRDFKDEYWLKGRNPVRPLLP